MRSLDVAKLWSKSIDRALVLIAAVLVVAIIVVARY
jgi:flagellar biosynthesis protein FliQ